MINPYKATPSDTLVSGPPPASDFILGFLSHYWISISLFLLRMRIMVHVVQNSVIMIIHLQNNEIHKVKLIMT